MLVEFASPAGVEGSSLTYSGAVTSLVEFLCDTNDVSSLARSTLDVAAWTGSPDHALSRVDETASLD